MEEVLRLLAMCPTISYEFLLAWLLTGTINVPRLEGMGLKVREGVAYCSFH
jgi:hypothetical protein